MLVNKEFDICNWMFDPYHAKIIQNNTFNKLIIKKNNKLESYGIISNHGNFIESKSKKVPLLRLHRLNDTYYYPSDEFGNYLDGFCDFNHRPEFALIYKNHVVILHHRCGSTTIRSCYLYANNRISKDLLYNPKYLCWNTNFLRVSDIVNLKKQR